MARDGEKKIVVKRWEVRELVTEHLWYRFLSRNLSGKSSRDLGLEIFREDLFGQFSNPLLKERSDNARVVQLVLVE